MDSLNIGPTPHDEECAQVGTDNYYERARKECRAYINQLRRVYGQEPFGARLYIKENPHDFGTYLDVECKYIENNEEACEYAFKCEAGCPYWDDEARRELGL